MGIIRRNFLWLVAGCCTALAFAVWAYRLGHQHGWFDADAVGFRAGLEAAQEEAQKRAAEAFQTGYTLGKLEGIVGPRRQLTIPSGAPTSCVTCHAGRSTQPPEGIDPDRSAIPLRLRPTTKPLMWQTSD